MSRHVHDPKVPHQQPPSPVPLHMAMTGETKVKTVLCNNFPLGKCRYGDKCRYNSSIYLFTRSSFNSLLLRA